MKSLYALAACLLISAQPAEALEVNITKDTGEFVIKHGDRDVRVLRNQEMDNIINFDYALTSRPCPPFCAQPMSAAPGVETIGEVELIEFMQTSLADGSGVLVDARTPDWFERGTIPGSTSLPFTALNPAQGADDITLEESLALLGVTPTDDAWNFSSAKRVVLWCNGPWCGQSPTAIRGLLSIGYPAGKLLYYRGGMQSWQSFGLTVIKPD